jgi:hypothetical protein
MIWDEVMSEAILPMLEADAALIAALGGAHIYAAQSSRPVRIPSVEWVLTDDRYTEVFNPLEVQFDFWAASAASAVEIERRLRTLLHRETRRRIAGIDMATLFTDAFSPTYPKPGVIHKSLRFRFEPVRHRYAHRVAS